MRLHTSPELLRRFWRLALINILSNITVPIASLVDVAFLGHLSEIHYLAGVALTTVLFNYIYWTFGFLRMGTTGTTAQAVGRGELEEVKLIGLRNVIVALFIGLAILLLQQPLREVGFALLSGSESVEAVGRAYYNGRIWGAPATLLNFVFIGWFLGREQSGRVLLLTLVGNTANVVLDYLFIVRWQLGGMGAGIATAISEYLALLVGVGFAGSVLLSVGIQQNIKQVLDRNALRATLVLNSNILVRTFALISTFAVFTNLSSAMGTAVLATNAVLLQVITLAAYFIDGLAFATESLAGIFRGQGEAEHLKLLLWLSGGTSLLSGLVFALTFVFLPGLLSLLTTLPEVSDRIGNYTPWLLPVLGFGSIAYMLDGYFLGLTEGKILRQSAIIAALVGFAPVAVAAWIVGSIQLLWLALSLFMVVRAVTLGIRVPQTLDSQGLP